jgi:hypothetical protein
VDIGPHSTRYAPDTTGYLLTVEGSSSPFKAWHLPIAVAGIAIPIVGATMLGGPPAGLGASFLVAATIVYLAARASPREPIEVASADRAGARVLVVACTGVDEPLAAEAVAEAAEEAGAEDPSDADVLVVAPASGSRLGHWLSDLGPARLGAQERLAVSLATLAAAGIGARGRVGDPDPTIATEDTLRTFAATSILFVTELDDERAERAAADVRDRASVPLRHVALGPAPVT